MKRWLPFLLTAWSMLAGTQLSSAQWVTVPDPNFLAYLQTTDVAGCLNGDQLDASCPAVVNKTILNCGNLYISDLTGIGAFVNLQTLYCDHNQLASLPGLPAPLKNLYCPHNQLTILPGLPDSLSALNCNFNQLTALPSLPTTLAALDCHHNQLTALPVLPTSLDDLDCHSNQLIALPNLPASLGSLICSQNQISTVPTLPDSLTYFDCSYNDVTVIPELSDVLTHLTCNDNQISTLPSLPTSLTSLDCSHNLLGALPALPGSLVILGCNNNQLTELPSLPASMIILACSSNQLTALPDLPDSSFGLYCAGNQLTTLPNLPAELTALNISYNPGITCLPPLEKITGSAANSSIAGTGITCLPNIIQHSGSIPSIDNMPLCDVFGNGCEVAWNIEGFVYLADDGNCGADSSEPHVQNIKLQLSQNGVVQQQVYSNGAGNFSFNTDLGDFDVTVDTTGLPFSVLCPANNVHTSALTVADSLDYNRNFAVLCNPGGYDVGANDVVRTSGAFFPADTAVVSIHAGGMVSFYGVVCNTVGVQGEVTATVSGPVSVTGVSGNGLVAGNTVTWNVSDFSQANFFDDFQLTLVTDTFAQVGSPICVIVVVTNNSGADVNGSNNTLSHCFSVVNSFDPNIKEAYPYSWHQPNEWIAYTVHFQNTGTAAAQHIQIKDTLDENLDRSSFQLLSYSHDNLTQVLSNGIVHFNFPNINLPDSNSNEPDSHGWIRYRIKTNSDIQPGTTVHNTAAIYFDFNDPVITNDAVVTYCLPVETQQTFSLCPGDSIQVGSNMYHQAGTYTNLFTSPSGCDSSVITTVNVDNIDTTLSIGNASIAANGDAASYQWFDCNTNQPIAGETNQIFTPLQNGSYSVQLGYGNDCATMSSCVNWTGTGVASIHQGVVNVYPNPSQGAAQFDFNGLRGALTIYNALGQAVRNVKVNEAVVALNELPQGLLTYKFLTDNGALHHGKIAVQK